MTGLRIAPELDLPLDLVTEPIGILANRGRGKSYTTHVLVEEIHDADVPVVVLDVKGDWWGLRSSADGKADGLPFYIFGGDHADLPLEPTAGELLADLVVDERVSVVLDLSHMSKTKARSFTVAFAERLYHRNRDPLFVVVDEADVLIPQRATAETARLLGAMEDIAKRGRGRGIGMAVVTQRPQEVAKSVLDLMDTLILLGMTGPRSLKSVSEWISAHVDEGTTAATVMAQLPSLPVGQAWVWSPMHALLERVAVRRIRTFDSHVTPKPGQTRTAPRGRIDLDLDALGEKITATVERAKADDPKTLRARIRDLERELDQERATTPGPVEVRVEVPVLAPEIVDQLEALLEPAAALLGETQETLLKHRIWAEQQLARPPKEGKQGQPTTRSSAPRAIPTSSTTGRAPVAGSSTTREKNPSAGRETRPVPAGGLGKGESVILAAIAQYADGVTAEQLSVLTGYKRSSRNTYLQRLKAAGCVETLAGQILATDVGIETLGDDYEPLPTGEALREHWLGKLPEGERRILTELMDDYPASVSGDELDDRTGYKRSSRNTYLQRLRARQLVTTQAGDARASDTLFLDGTS